MKSEREEWLHIAAYESGKRDMLMTLTNLFGTDLSKPVQEWMRQTGEDNERQAKEAERKAKADLPLVAILSDFKLNLLNAEIAAELKRREEKAA